MVHQLAAIGPSAPATYMAVGAVLIVLVMITLWREMTTTNATMFFSRSFAALAFVASRVIVVVFTASLVARSSAPPVAYAVLSTLLFYLAAASLPRVIVRLSGESAVDVDARARDGVRTLQYQMGVFGLAGALIYVVVPQAGGFDWTISGFVAMACGGATVAGILHSLTSVRSTGPEMRTTLIAMVGSMASSWLLVVAAAAFENGPATVFLQAARAMDILTLVTGLLALQTTYMMQGFYHKNRADWTEAQAERTKEELSLLNRVASDLYEDSSSMIQRQQDRFRKLTGRNESLEKILRIGVELQKHKSLRDLTQIVAEMIRDNLGFNTVILRLLNERTQSFETRAFIGVNDDLQSAVMNHRLPYSEYENMLEPRYRISRSYFLKDAGKPAQRSTGENGVAAIMVSDHWSDIDRLIVPLVDEDADGRTIGYISVEDPCNENISIVDAIDNLETIATLAVSAIRNASYYKEVGEKNEKLRQYADKLSGLNKMKSNFVATISHEFRTPLTSIKAYCETLLRNADSVDRNIMKEFLVVIDEESDRLMALIEDILDFSQMESGAIKFERTPCNVNEIVAEAISELENNFVRKNITVRADMDGTTVTVRAERELVKQLLVNLLHNASKFTPDNGRVWVRVEDETVSARIIVEDDGIGIPEDQLERIFDHFHQVDNTSTRKYGGTGIGLAICKNIVDWHDGKIWVENVPGHGARFIVVIPKKQVVVRNHVFAVDGTVRRLEVERYLEILVEMVAELMNVRKVSLMLKDPASGDLRIESAIGIDEEIVEHARVRIGEGIAGRVANESRSYLVEDIDRDSRVSIRNNDYMYDSRSFLSVPINSGGIVIGVINVANPAAKDTFTSGDQHLLELFSSRVALALEKLEAFTEMSSGFEGVRTAFKSMLDARRYVTDENNVGMEAVLADLAEKMGMTGEEAATLRYTFNVYDLGLARLGYNIIKQPRTLTPEDWKSVEQHTIVGTEMLRPIEATTSVRDAVLYHHENYDGSGYPGCLSGDEIPINARIIRVADAFRAMLSHRPYQKQYSVSEAIDVLTHRSGTFFDPVIVKLFAEAARNHEERFRTMERDNQQQEAVVVSLEDQTSHL